MKISYDWLKWYIPEVPEPKKLRNIFTYHLCEVENIEEKNGDFVFDINILPNRAHDLLSHQGIARELASLLDISFTDPVPKYKVPQSRPTDLKIKIESKNCRRYMGRIIRNVKVGPSPDWVKGHLESIGQRSINNMVDAANLVMYDLGQPAHVFDLDKLGGGLVIRDAKEGEKMTTLDNRNLELKKEDLVISDFKGATLGLAGIKGGKIAEVDENTKNILIEIANFDPIITRRSGQRHGIFTDARKRFENDLSPELCELGMLEISGLLAEYGETGFEDVVDLYPNKQEKRELSFSTEKISSILGEKISSKEIKNILNRYHLTCEEKGSEFMVSVPPLRLDLIIEEDMAEEIGRILGYDKVKPKIPKIKFEPKINETYAEISKARENLLSRGYSEVMTYVFAEKGKVEVRESASDKKFLRTNLADGLKESLKLNKLNSPLLGLSEVKIFEIGAVWDPEEEIHVGWNEGDKIIEKELDEYK